SQLLASLLEKNKGLFSADVARSKLEVKAVDVSKLNADGKPLPAPLANLATWRGAVVVAVPTQFESDNSNTQFAILGLWAAKARGVPVERTLALLVQRFHQTQNDNGTWGYEIVGDRKAVDVSGPPMAMTCAGLLGLAVGQGLVNEARGKAKAAPNPAAQQDPAIHKGLDYLATQIGNPNKPWQNASGAPLGNLYAMWSLERMGVIFGLDRIGGKDWYGWGAEKLVASQTIMEDKGYWPLG